MITLPRLSRAIRRIAFPLLLTLPFALPAAELRTASAVLTVDDGEVRIVRQDRPVVVLTGLQFDYHRPLDWTLLEAQPERLLYELTFPAGVNFWHAATDEEPRTAQLEITVHGDGFRFFADPEWGDQVTLEFESLGDRFFGLSSPLQPDNRLSPDLTGTTIDVEVASEGQTIVENYASAFSAFYMSSFGYGSFFDTFARGEYAFAINGVNRIHHDTGRLDWYLFFGDDGAEIHKAYFDLIGAPKQVPHWALGPVAWRDENSGGADEILADVEGFHERRIPLTAWWVDRPYSEGAAEWSEMNFGPGFEDPSAWIGRLREEFGLEFMTWTATATFGDRRFPRHLRGHYSYLDLSHQPTAEAYAEELVEEQYRHGVRGHKIDRSDEHFPMHEDWADGTPKPGRRNRYVYLTMKIHHEVLQEVWGEDQATFARAAIHRTQPYLSAVWGGDPRSTWAGFRGNFANGIRASFLGFPVWGSDVGGYLGDGWIPADLYLRWMQAGSMSGFFEIKLDGAGGAGDDRLPWRYDEEFVEQYRRICEDRMRLLPYFHSLANRSAELGAVMQPMAYRHLDDPEAWPLWDQFYVGAILVAPVFGPGEERAVYLPPGRWHDFDDWTRVWTGGREVTVAAPLEKLPRFVAANALWVTGHLPVGNVAKWNDSAPRLTLHALPGEGGDETIFTYLDPLDGDRAKTVMMGHAGNAITVRGPAFGCDVEIELHLPEPPPELPAGATYEASGQILRKTIPAGQPLTLDVPLD